MSENEELRARLITPFPLLLCAKYTVPLLPVYDGLTKSFS